MPYSIVAEIMFCKLTDVPLSVENCGYEIPLTVIGFFLLDVLLIF
jgi:hypothetical protein